MKLGKKSLLWALVSTYMASFAAAGADAPASLNVQSSDFAAGALIPKLFSGDGRDISPGVIWSKAPEKTKSIAVTCTDSDAPRGTWWHWIIFNIPPEQTQLKASQGKDSTLAGGIEQGTNDFGNTGYNGPAPPRGPIHHYHFTVYALDTKLGVRPGCTKQEFSPALNGHVLAQGEYIGTFVRR